MNRQSVEATTDSLNSKGLNDGKIIRILTEFSTILPPSIPDILQSYDFWQK